MKALLIVALLLALLAGGAFLVWEPIAAVKVRTVEATIGDVEAVLTTNGRIEAGSRYEVFAETTGRILQVPVRVGDVIQRGRPLAVVDDHAALEALESAEARLAAARAELSALESGLSSTERAELESRASQLDADLQSYESELRQTKRLAAKSAIPALEVEATKRRIERAKEELALVRRKLSVTPLAAEVESAQARIREAKARMAAARRQVGSATVRAPIDGVVYSLSVERGVFVRPGAPVARLAGEEAPRARLLIDEPELGKVRLGAAATLSADAFPGERWACRIDLLPTEVVEVGTRRVGEARCMVDPGGSKGSMDRLLPNLTVDVAIAVDRAEGVVSLPREVVTRDDGQEFVWIADEGLARRQSVEVGIRGGERVEIRSGIAAGEHVLVPGPETWADGTPVEIEEP